MKKVFALYENGQFQQYLLLSEIRLIKWDKDIEYTLKPIEMTQEHYELFFWKVKPSCMKYYALFILIDAIICVIV